MKKRLCRLLNLTLVIGTMISALAGCGNENKASSSSEVIVETGRSSADQVKDTLEKEKEDNLEISDGQEGDDQELDQSDFLPETSDKDENMSSNENEVPETAHMAEGTPISKEEEKQSTPLVEDSMSAKEEDRLAMMDDTSVSDEYSDMQEEETLEKENQPASIAFNEQSLAEDDEEMTVMQRNSLNMMNYLTVLTQEINDSKGSRLYVENAYSSLLNNTYPNAADTRTQAQLTNILDTLESYRMVDVKRERLEYIYEQNRAKAMREALPSPMSVLNVVQSGNLLKSAASVVYMAVDSRTSYAVYTEQSDLQYLQDGWELDDEEAEELHNSRKQAFTYMLSMVRENELPGDYALNEDSVQKFVTWKNIENVTRKISFLESNQETYEAFGTYWLTLAEGYYESGDYQKCLSAIEKYQDIYSRSRIFRKDYDYAKVLPLGIVAAKEVYGKNEYIEIAEDYAENIIDNTDNTDWTLSYFVAQTYLDLYAQTENRNYAEMAYKIAYDNVNYLVDEQKELNENYLADVVEKEISKDASKREKEEIKQYNKMLKAERKTALPPVSEALYLNCDLLFALADELNVSSQEKEKVNNILHENGDNIFLVQMIDNRFWFDKGVSLNVDDIEVSFEGDTFAIPATYMSSNSSIKVTVKEEGKETVFDDWVISEVERKKGAVYTEFTASFKSQTAKEFKFTDGIMITIEITPVEEDTEERLVFTYRVIGVKKALVFNGITFERM